jgi:uncharacterized protein YdhG (YjbR/CyaY superfamily)
MPKRNFTSVDEYIASQPEAARRRLKRLRSTLRKALPGAEEMISYQIPTYKLNGRPVIYFAGWKRHYSLYPCTRHVVTAFTDDLARLSSLPCAHATSHRGVPLGSNSRLVKSV